MAAKYLRRQTWWARFYHPCTGELIRGSLETADEARAELLRRHIELLAERIKLEQTLQEPRFQAAEIPAPLLGTLDPLAPASAPAVVNPSPVAITNGPVTPAPLAERVRLDTALKKYLAYIRTENVPHHVLGKLSMLRGFLGTDRVNRIAGVTEKDENRFPKREAFFEGEFVDELTAALLQEFFDTLSVSIRTKRHYREMFHHFFKYCINFGLYQPANFHCPNPVVALPSYLVKNQKIVFLTQEQIDQQLEVLEDRPALRIATAIMIYAGLRRAETLWLTKDSIAKDLSYLSVLNRVDDDDIESSLKTGERSVTILLPLRKILEDYLPRLKGRWIVPARDGRRWELNAFSRRLREVNKRVGVRWTCLEYRHTYATQRAAEGWTLFRIAKEMGNSVAVVEKYYAAYVRPDQAATQQR